MKDMPIENATCRKAATSETKAVMDVWTTVFELDESFFGGMIAACPPDQQSTFVAETDDKIVSVVQVYAIPLRDELGRTVMVGAIGNVSTYKEFRGRGFSTGLLNLAIEDMERRGCQWSYLFTGVPGFYQRLGWDHVEYRTLHAMLPIQEPTSIVPRPVQEEDLPALKAIYDEAYDEVPLSFVRTEADWRIKMFPRLNDAFIVANKTSYALLKENKDELVVIEFATTRPEDVRPLLKGAFGWANSRSMKSLKFAAPLPESIRQIVLNMIPHRWEPEGAGMVRPIASEWTMERLQNLFKDPGARFAPHEGF